MDEEIIEAILNREPEGLERLKSGYGSLLRYVVSGVLTDERDVEECLSDVYIKIWHWDNISKFDISRGGLKPWLTTIARNAAVDRKRRANSKETELSESDAVAPSPEDELLKRERGETLLKAVRSLETSERRIIYRKYYYLQSTAQIAAELGVTEKTVEGRLYRIRKKLRSLMGGDGNG